MIDQEVRNLVAKGKRHCWYLIESFKHENGSLRPSIVFEDSPTHFPTCFDYGRDFTKAKATVAAQNAKMGITPEDAEKIVESSLIASMRGGPNAP